MGALLAAFVAEIGLITYRDVAGSTAQKQNHTVAGLPLPADYMAAILLFGVLGLASSPGAQKTAALFGWGIVIATYMNLMPGVPKPIPGATGGSSSTTTSATTTAATSSSNSGGLI